MKKLLIFILITALTFSFTSCISSISEEQLAYTNSDNTQEDLTNAWEDTENNIKFKIYGFNCSPDGRYFRFNIKNIGDKKIYDYIYFVIHLNEKGDKQTISVSDLNVVNTDTEFEKVYLASDTLNTASNGITLTAVNRILLSIPQGKSTLVTLDTLHWPELSAVDIKYVSAFKYINGQVPAQLDTSLDYQNVYQSIDLKEQEQAEHSEQSEQSN